MSAFVVCLVVVFVACAALVVDGGRFVAARSDAADAAENAARAGAQELTDLRTGSFVIDPPRAVARATSFLASAGFRGSAVADTQRVTVTVNATVTPQMLGLFGVGARSFSVTRSASPLDR
jgi:Flp pilus assembly protein TadG